MKNFALVAPIILAALLLGPRTASAIPEYPEALESLAGAPCPPPCTVCHRDQNGGAGTVVKPFGEAMINAGLDGSEASLAPAFDILKQDATDSDGDGTSDVEELADGTDPNASAGAPLCGPTYGCGARVEPSGAIDASAALAAGIMVLALSVTARLRRRRRRRGSCP